MKHRILIRDIDIGTIGSVASGTWQNNNQAVKALIPKFTRAKVTVDYIKLHFDFDSHACGLCQTGVPCESKLPLEVME